MNEIKRLKIWYKERIEDWENTVTAIGFGGVILNLIAMVIFATVGKLIAFLFLASLIVWVFGINFLTHEYEIEKSEENLKIFLKDVDEHFKRVTTSLYIKISSYKYQTIPYDMLMKALEDYGIYAKTLGWGPDIEKDYWEPFEETDYEYNRALYLIKKESLIWQ